MNPGDAFDDSEDSARLRALYRRLPAEEPSAELDETILAAARRAAGSKPRAVVSWTRRWRTPLAAAAVLVLAVGVLMQEPWQRTTMPEALTPEIVYGQAAAEAPAAAAPASAPAPAEAGPAESLAEKSPPKERAVADAYSPAQDKLASKPAAANEPMPARKQTAAGQADDDVAGMDGELAEQRDAAARAFGEEAKAKAEMDTSTRQRLDAEREVQAQSLAKNSGAASAPAPAAPAAALAGSEAAPMPAPVASAPPVLPRGAPWPFGLVPTLTPDTACARLVQDSGGRCHGRVISGGLELRLVDSDPAWLPGLRDALRDLGWQEDSASSDGARYSRTTTAGIERFSWSLQAGSLVLRLQSAATP